MGKRIWAYCKLTKPGIIMGNAMTATAGYFLGSSTFTFTPWAIMLLGLSFVIGSACILNNYIDRKADQQMKRTQSRPLAAGSISATHAICLAIILAIFGFGILAVQVHILSAVLAFIGFFVYLILYTFSKYHTSASTWIGSIAGGIPPLVGYTAIHPHLDMEAWLLFLIVALWQMPHFFAIAIYRLEEYKAAAIPVYPLQKGMLSTKIQMLIYVIFFASAVFLLSFLGYAGTFYMLIMSIISIAWIVLCIRGFQPVQDKKWARKMFFFSLQAMTVLCFMIAIDRS